MDKELCKIIIDNKIDGKKMCNGEAIDILLNNGVDINNVLHIIHEWNKEVERNKNINKDNIE